MICRLRLLTCRSFCSRPLTKGENEIRNVLTCRFPQANVNVTDISGGCGAMFEVFIESREFQGLTTLKQHQMVTNILKEQIKEMHGVRIHTTIPK